MAKARRIPNLSAREPYASAAAKILSVRSQELLDHCEGVLGLEDIERVHAMRVATRRLRATLEVFAPCFPAKAHAAALAEVKGLADALGERRDRDVAISSLISFSEGLPAPDRRGVASLLGVLRLEQARANEALRPAVDAGRMEGLHASLRDLAASVGGGAPDEGANTALAVASPAPAAGLAREPAGNGAGPAA